MSKAQLNRILKLEQMYERPAERLKYVAKSYLSSAILKHLIAGSDCACLAVFETCPYRLIKIKMAASAANSEFCGFFLVCELFIKAC